MNHYRKTIHAYHRHQKSSGCPFCNAKTVANAIFENDFIYIVTNITQYDLWELHDVEDNLLIIPKRHVETFSDMNKDEKLAIINAISDYELLGYSAYARGVGFIKRSVKHQHTHLIKVTNKKPKLAIFLQSPYYLFKK